MKVKHLYIVRGVPGSGKTTLAHTISNHVFEADDYFMVDGVYKYLPEEISHAHRSCQKRVENAMMIDVSPIVVSNTFTRMWEMKHYVELAEKYGYSVTIHLVDPGLSVQELAARNTHGVTAEQIQAMVDRFEY